MRKNNISEGFPKFLEKIFLFTRTAITGFLKIMAYKTIVKAISVNSDALRELVPLVQFKKREKHPWRSVTFSKVTLLHGRFSRFLIVQMVPNRAKHRCSSVPPTLYQPILPLYRN